MRTCFLWRREPMSGIESQYHNASHWLRDRPATSPLSRKRESDSRPPSYQDGVLPLNYSGVLFSTNCLPRRKRGALSFGELHRHYYAPMITSELRSASRSEKSYCLPVRS